MVNPEIEATQLVLLTPQGFQRLQDELAYLTKTKRTEIAERIRDSKDHGEFSEDNNELDEVKMEQAIVESRIGELKAVFAGAEILRTEDISTERVGLGAWVTVEGDNGFEFEVRLVSSIEANPDEDLISEESPLGQALLGHKVGETVQFDAPDGRIRYTVKKIRAS